MKILLFSDIHIYRHLGYDIFPQTAYSFLQYLFDYAKKHHIKTIFFGGDLFHTKTKVDTIEFVKTKEIFSKNYKDFDIHMIVGNHDMPLPETSEGSILFALSDYAHIIGDYEFIDMGNVRYHFMSYRKEPNLPQFKLSPDKKNVLIAHQDIVGFKMNEKRLSVDGIDAAKLKDFDIIFSGHYHLHQVKGKIVYIGSPFQINFGERNQKKGFIVFDDSTFKWKMIQYKDAPVFKQIKYEEIDKADVKNAFVKVIVNSSINSREIKRELIYRGALAVEVSYDIEEFAKELEFIEEINKASIKKLATQYLENVEVGDSLKKKKLIDIFENINNIYISQHI